MINIGLFGNFILNEQQHPWWSYECFKSISQSLGRESEKQVDYGDNGDKSCSCCICVDIVPMHKELKL